MTDLVQARASLVHAGILRYQAGGAAPTQVPGVLAPPEGYAEVERAFHHLGIGRSWSGSLAFSATVLATIVPSVAFCALILTGGALGDRLSALAAALALATASLALVTRDNRILARFRAAEDARVALVPSSVADAYRRIVSAADEIEEGHPVEVIASVRLAMEGARDLVALIHDHHAAGTLHTTSAQDLVAEVYRLAAEADAYLVLARTQTLTIAPGEADALGVLSRTSQLTFPAVEPPELTM